MTYKPINKHVSLILRYLSTTQPISGVFQFSILDEAELALVVDLSVGMPRKVCEIDLLYKKMVNFKPLFLSYEVQVMPSESIRLHPLASGLLLKIIDKVENLYTSRTRKPVRVYVEQEYFNYFPAFVIG